MVAITRRKKWHEIEKMGQRIREARERLGLTQEELADLVGKGRDSISHYEIGDRAIVVTELPLLAQALKVNISYFFGQDDPDGEAMDLVSELKSMKPDQKKNVVARWRLELEWWRQHDTESKQDS